MIETTIVTKIDNTAAINAQADLRKEIKNLNLELKSLDKGTEEYKSTLDLLTQKLDMYKEKMNSIKNSSSQFSDIAINNTKIIQGLGEGFKDATTNVNLYAKAKGKLQSIFDKITNAFSTSNRLFNVKGSVDNSQEEALKKQAIAAEQANKALIGNSNTQAGLAAATAGTNNAIGLQNTALNNSTTALQLNSKELNENLSKYSLEQLEDYLKKREELLYIEKLEREALIEYNKVASQKQNKDKDILNVIDITIDRIEAKGKSQWDDLNLQRLLLQENMAITESESVSASVQRESVSIKNKGINDLIKSNKELAAEIKKRKLIESDTKGTLNSANASSELQKRNTMLAFSMAQIIREAPVLSMSMDMFFLAISNNLPMLFEQVKAMKTYNEALVKAGKSAEQVNIWKALGKSLLSWNSLMMVGITLLTAFGSDIGKFTKKLFENTEEVERNKKKIEERNNQLKLSSDAAKNAASEYATLNLMYKQWNNIKGDTLSIRQKWFNAHKETLAKTGKGYKDLKSLERDWAVNGIKEYQEGIKKRALATAAFTKLTELYGEKLRLEDPIRKTQLKENQETYDLLRKQAKKELIDYFNYTEYTAEEELKRIGQGGTINMVSNPGAGAMWDFYDFVKSIRKGELATVQSSAIIEQSLNKQIENYSKLADIKDNVIKQDTTRIENQIDKDRESIINLTTGLEKVNEDWYTSLKSINDEWIEEEKNKWLKGEQLESDYIKQKTQFIITSTNLEKLKAKDELRINNDLAKKGYDDEVKKLTEKEQVFKKHLNKSGKLNNEDKKLLEDLNNSKKLLEENYNKTVLNNETKFNAEIKSLNIKNNNDLIENTQSYYDTLIKEVDINYNILLNKMNEAYSKAKTEISNQQDISFWNTLFNINPIELDQQLSEITQRINIAKQNIIGGEDRVNILNKELEDLNTTAERKKEIEEEITNITKEQSDLRLEIAEAEAEKRKAINENMMAIVEGSLQSTSSVFQSVIDNNDASYEEAEKRYQQQLESGKITKDQYDKEILAAQQKQNEKNKKWQAGIAMIDGINGAVKALSGAMSLGPIAGPIVGGVQAAAIIASTVANIRKIYAQKVSDTGGSGGSVSSSSVADISAPLIYSANVTTQSQEEKLNQPIKVYVTESDITNVQNKVRVSESEATF